MAAQDSGHRSRRCPGSWARRTRRRLPAGTELLLQIRGGQRAKRVILGPRGRFISASSPGQRRPGGLEGLTRHAAVPETIAPVCGQARRLAAPPREGTCGSSRPTFAAVPARTGSPVAAWPGSARPRTTRLAPRPALRRRPRSARHRPPGTSSLTGSGSPTTAASKTAGWVAQRLPPPRWTRSPRRLRGHRCAARRP